MVTLVYADASYDKATKKAGLAVVIMRHNHGEKPTHQHLKKLEYAKDSNMAELQAVLYGVEQLKETDENIIIMTDNKVLDLINLILLFRILSRLHNILKLI